MININDANTPQATIDAYEAWLDQLEQNWGKPLTIVTREGEQYILERTTHRAEFLISLERGFIHRNGWCPANALRELRPKRNHWTV
jgi:hypothetical protein